MSQYDMEYWREERDAARAGSWMNDTFIPDELMEDTHMASNEKRDKIRHDLVQFLHDAMDGDEMNIVRMDEPKLDRTGPMGGVSSQLSFWVEDGEDIHPVTVNVYCDDNIEQSLLAEIRLERREQERRRQVRAEVLGEEEENGHAS